MMRRSLLVVAVTALAVWSVPARVASAEPARSAPAPSVDAAAWFVMAGDGSVLAERDAREPRAIASITKLMTAVVVLERASLTDMVQVSPRAARIGESTAYLRPGEELSVAELLRAMLIPSANDAAEALALYVGRGSADRFVQLMNAKAQQLGLTDTHFENPHGLDAPGHVSSARDTTLLVRYALGVPFIRETLTRSSVSLPGGRVLRTTDDVLESWRALVAGKTGHTSEAGWSEAAAARGVGVTVFGTVLGSDSRSARNDALRELLSYGLRQYRRVQVIAADRVYAEAATGYGRRRVELVASRPVVRTLRVGTSLVERVVGPASVALPVRPGQPFGRVAVYEGDRLVASSRLVAAASIDEPGLAGKAAWFATTTVGNLWGMLT